MPLTQEKRLENNFSNNNDHSYLHKKFKKMASTMAALPSSPPKGGEIVQRETNVTQANSNTAISNGSISAAHPEIEKIKDITSVDNGGLEKNVQINFNNDCRLRNVDNIQISGQTSYTEEFSNKTENLENELIRDAHNGGSSGRYICPYCKLSCAKPSVLQKHIRAHTNERPYPCVPCGFAFKTKSNLYKHRRSRTHALRLLGADVSASMNDEDMSGGSESDTSSPSMVAHDAGSDTLIIRNENSRPNEFSSPELTNDSTAMFGTSITLNDSKSKTIYKPKFRATFYQESDDNIKKTISSNADFLTEHISKIISDNEAIVDVIETPLQKKYNKIKQIAESKQFLSEANDVKPNLPLNLTKQNEPQNSFRKRSHSESFSQYEHQKNLNPEGSIIKDLLLKTKANGCLSTVTSDTSDGSGHLFVCPLCQILYRSADNLEIHRMYYCKGSSNAGSRASLKELKNSKSENIFMRSNSINVRLPETQASPPMKASIKASAFRSKPDNLIIIKPETNDVVAPLPSPGPLLGNTRLVDSRASDYVRRSESQRTKPLCSPIRRIENSPESYSPRLVDNMSPRSDLYLQPKLRCFENNSSLRSIDNTSPLGRHHSTSLQMFGGEVKILDHSGSTTTLRIEPSKNQLSPILIHQSLSPSKLANDSEASSVVVRSGLHSGGTMVHNPPTPKELLGIPHPQTPRAAVSTVSGIVNQNIASIHDMSHFQFPPLSAITAYNPLTLPPLSPTSSPNGATTIMHGGKLIPHVPGIPGPNTGGLFMGNSNTKTIVTSSDCQKSNSQPHLDVPHDNYPASNLCQKNATKFERIQKSRSPNLRSLQIDTDKISQIPEKSETPHYVYSPVPIIKVRNVDEPSSHKTFSPNIVKPLMTRPESALKRNADGSLKNNVKDNYPTKMKNKLMSHSDKAIDSKPENNDIRNFNFETLITKAEIYGNQVANCTEVQKNTNVDETSDIKTHERSETAYFQKNVTAKGTPDDRKPKFLRPSTLPLKPGTFTPKRHHGITPNANTMPLVSPETPRPSKAYGQLYLNGNAYTYLGLKCSTKVFYCTINRPQPTYVPNQHFLSMYSNWQLLSELTPDPLGLSATSAMSLYDSRHRPQSTRVATIKQDLILTHSSRWNHNIKDNKEIFFSADGKQLEESTAPFCENNIAKKELAGGFESNEEYTYVRGRGRGRYVCSECGIRCKKPSMLKKHIRTHTDVRPYTCIHCAFSFKTKGNLTKHMKSKAHYKKCCELGINPNEGNDPENADTAQCSGDTDDETDSDGDEGNEGETESSDTEACKSRLPEHEAAHCLLSLGGPRTATSSTPGLISARPSTYPYNPTGSDASTEPAMERHRLLRSVSVDSSEDLDDEPMDLSKADVKVSTNISEIPTARESSVLASLASNTAKLPQPQIQETFQDNGEPLLHNYLTERALQDSKIKQSQLAYGLNKKVDMDKSSFKDNLVYTDSSIKANKNLRTAPYSITVTKPICSIKSEIINNINVLRQDTVQESNLQQPTVYNCDVDADTKRNPRPPSRSNAENAKQVVSEYLKQAKINLSPDDNAPTLCDDMCDDNQSIKLTTEDNSKDDGHSDTESIKMPTEHDPVARKVVVGAGGVAFKVSKGKDFEGGQSFSPSRLMEDGRRVCDFCNKTFTKPSQLRLHLNIHYMERPFRCSVCAVSFRTRGHLQKHERSGSHHNKVSMTSTFGAATSFNPRPFRCFDCNIAFRIHGHLAKHLRSKMHVMRLECLFKLPFGTFTEIERAGVSLTEIDTTDCASSLASLQSLARKLHEKDPTKLEYHEPSDVSAAALSDAKDFPEEDDAIIPTENVSDDYEKDNEKTNENSACKEKESTYL